MVHHTRFNNLLNQISGVAQTPTFGSSEALFFQSSESAPKSVSLLNSFSLKQSTENPPLRCGNEGSLDSTNSINQQLKVTQRELREQQFAVEEGESLLKSLLQQIQGDLDSVPKENIVIMRSLANPPQDVIFVCQAVNCLLKNTQDLAEWTETRKDIPRNISKFWASLSAFDVAKISPKVSAFVKDFVESKNFEHGYLSRRNHGAASLGQWVLNQIKRREIIENLRANKQRLMMLKAEEELLKRKNEQNIR